eukprot:4463720-Prymnesium_polylepis.1
MAMCTKRPSLRTRQVALDGGGFALRLGSGGGRSTMLSAQCPTVVANSARHRNRMMNEAMRIWERAIGTREQPIGCVGVRFHLSV